MPSRAAKKSVFSGAEKPREASMKDAASRSAPSCVSATAWTRVSSVDAEHRGEAAETARRRSRLRVDGQRRRVLVHHEPQRAEARGEVGRDRDRDRHGGGVRRPARQGQLNRAVRGALGHATVEQRGLQVLPALQPARRRRGVHRLGAAAHGRKRSERGGAQDDGAPAEAAGRGAHAGNSVSKVGGRARRDRQRYAPARGCGSARGVHRRPFRLRINPLRGGRRLRRAFPPPRGRAPAAAPARPPRSRRRSGGRVGRRHAPAPCAGSRGPAASWRPPC